MIEILSRYFKGFIFLTNSISRNKSNKKIPLYLLTLAVYPISLFVILLLFLFSKISIILFKILNR
jgi:hypothetical protein